MNEPNSQRANRIHLEVPADLRAIYVNLALIAHTANEFFPDFAQILPNVGKSQVHSRMVMTPTHAKLLYRALGENIERYEAKHGSIDIPPSLADQLFRNLRSAEGSTQTEISPLDE